MLQIVVFGIDTRQGCNLFKVVPPHLILVAQICVCIIIGNLDRVIDALRQFDWFHIKFKSIVGGLSLAKISLPVIQIWSSHFCLAIIVWVFIVANSCIRHWHEELFKVIPPHLILVAGSCVCTIIGSLDRVIDVLRQVDWFHIKFKSIVGRLFFCKIFLHRYSLTLYLLTLKPTNNNGNFGKQSQINNTIHICEHSTPLVKDGPGQDWGWQLEDRAPVWGRHGCLLQKWQWNTRMQNP